MTRALNPHDPWQETPPAGVPRESFVVVALDASAAPFLARLEDQAREGLRGQVVVVCSDKTASVATLPQWVTIVPVPEGQPVTLTEARCLGVAHAIGDVIYVTTSQALSAALQTPGSGRSWADRLVGAGVVRPSDNP